MKQVKIIEQVQYDILQNEINEFIKDKNVISISYQTYRYPDSYPDYLYFSAMIVYEVEVKYLPKAKNAEDGMNVECPFEE